MIFIILKKSLPSNGANIIPERKRSKPYAYETSILLPNKRKIINYRFEMPKLNKVDVQNNILHTLREASYMVKKAIF